MGGGSVLLSGLWRWCGRGQDSVRLEVAAEFGQRRAHPGGEEANAGERAGGSGLERGQVRVDRRRAAMAATAATATPTSIGSQSLLARSAGLIPTLASQNR